MNKKIRQILMFITCIMVMVVCAIQKEGKLLGKKVVEDKTTKQTAAVPDSAAEVLKTLDDGTVVVNTTSLCKEVTGYAGTVPLELYIKDGAVDSVNALPNEETPEFFDEVRVLFTQWKGKTVDDALATKVDVVTGATFSSKALIKNMEEGLRYAAANMPDSNAASSVASSGTDMDLSAKSIIGLIVVLAGALIPLFFKNKTMRTVQLILNVAVLGFWCGTFLNYTFFLHALSNGLNLWTYIIPVLMLITAFIYPLFGKKQHYCTHICPFGSLQDLAGKVNKKKLKLSAGMVKGLTWFRKLLWFVLMALMVAGLWFDWINYEFFTAFIFQAASVVVIVLAVVCTLTSIFVPRPYCRFVCPTGTLMKMAEG